MRKKKVLNQCIGRWHAGLFSGVFGIFLLGFPALAAETVPDDLIIEGELDARRDSLVRWGMAVWGPTLVGQNLIVDGVADFRGTVYNSSGAPVTIGDGFDVWGSARFRQPVVVGSHLLNDAGTLVLGDDVRVSGDLNQRGDIYNSGGFVTVDDTLNVKGRSKTRRLTVLDLSTLRGVLDATGAAVLMRGVQNKVFTLDKGSQAGDEDVSLQFSDDGNDSAHALTWNDGNDRFEFGSEEVQSTAFVAGTASTTLSDGSLSATGALSIASGDGSALSLDSAAGTIMLAPGTNGVANTDSEDLTLSSAGGTVAIDPSDIFVVGGGFGSGGLTVSSGGDISSEGLAALDGGIDVDGMFTVADGTGNVATTGDLAADGSVDFSDGADGDTISIGDTGDTVDVNGDVSLAGSTDETFIVDVDNSGGAEPADGSGFVIEGGTGDVSMLWNATDNQLEFSFGGGLADIQGGAAMFDSLDVSGQTTLGTTVDINAPSITLDADNTSGAGVDTSITFERGTDGAAGQLLFDETTDDRFEFNYDVATVGAVVSETLEVGGGFGSSGVSLGADGVVNADGLASLDGGIDVDGVFSVADGTGAIDINAGTIDGTPIGAVTPAAADVTALFVNDVMGFGVTTFTLTDDGTANDTLTPSSSFVEVDADESGSGSTPNLVISETNASPGDYLFIINVETDGSHSNFTITDTSGQTEISPDLLASTLTLGPLDSITLLYSSAASAWVQVGYSDN